MTTWSTYKDTAAERDAEAIFLSVGDIIETPAEAAESTHFARGRYRARTLCPFLQYFDCDLCTVDDLCAEGEFIPGLCIGLAFDGAWSSTVGDRDVAMSAGTGPVVYGAGREMAFTERQSGGTHIRMASLYVGAELLSSLGAGNELPPSLAAILDTDRLSLRQLPPCTALQSLFEQMYRNPCSGYLDHLRMNGLALAALAELACLDERATQPTSCPPRQREIAHAVRGYLDANRTQLPLIADVAARFGTNESSLRRAFKAAFGVGVVQYVREGLLAEARASVREGRMQIAEIAYRCGFSDPANFTAAYRRHFGHPPSVDRHRR